MLSASTHAAKVSTANRRTSMRRIVQLGGMVLVCHLLAVPAHAQGTRADYDRANALRQRTEGTVFKSHVEPHWFDQGTKLWYRNDLPDAKREFMLVDAVQGASRPAFDHGRLAMALGKAAGKDVTADRLPLERLTFEDGAKAIRFSAFSQRWHCLLENYELKSTEKEPPPAS